VRYWLLCPDYRVSEIELQVEKMLGMLKSGKK